MTTLIEIHLQADELESMRLPDFPYPLPPWACQQARAGSGLPLKAMLYGLQVRSAESGNNWKCFEAPLERLAQLVAQDVNPELMIVSGATFWLEIGPVSLDGKLVTVQRGDDLIAGISPREDGRLRVAVFRPLDAKSIRYLIGLGLLPHPEHGVCMRENNWEYALDCSAGNGNYYARESGEAYLSFWEHGLGILWDGRESPEFRNCHLLSAREPAQVAAEILVYDSASAEEV